MTDQENLQDRLLLINKPLRWTSFDVVNKLRNILNIKKIGHAGTLDPLATGLLIICTGKMTRRIEEFMGLEKEYTGTLVLGQTTPSHDLETTVSESKDISHLTTEAIQHAALQLTGTILQIPPSHSAIKIGGKRAYALARKGKEPDLPPREVVVKEFVITKVSLPDVYFRVTCSKGTYIRSLVRDFGETLGVGAYLSQLCRTRIGDYHLADALTLDQVK
ncbi:MAG: tRNA pseudouridine(55) synthase TruB [Cyclobacteriaceae bacterium]